MPTESTAPAAKPETTLAAQGVSWEDDLSSTIDSLPDVPEGGHRGPRARTGPSAIPPKETPKKPQETPQAKTPPKPQEKPEAPPDKEPEAAAKPSVQDPEKEEAPEPAKEEESDPTAVFKTAHDLRKEYRKVLQAKKNLEQEVARIKSQPTKPSEDPERKALTERFSAMEKRLQEAETELRHANYLKSSEYREKYETPFVEALNDAHATIKEFTVETEEGSRPATQADFDRLMELPLGEAIKQAKTMFGDAADEVLSHRRKLGEIRRNAARAVEKYQKEGSELEKTRLAKTAEQKEAVRKLWESATEEIATKYSDLFGEVKGEDEGNQMLRAGYVEVDKAHDPNLPLEERIRRQAAIRHRAAALKREVWRNKQLKARVAELEKVVREYEESVPGEGSKDGDKEIKTDENDPNAEIDRMAS